MEILRDLSQIENKVKEIFDFPSDFNFENFISKQIDIETIKSIKLKSNKSENIIEQISDLIFQLRNYIYALSNLVRIFLSCNMQTELYHFVKRLFIGQIGPIKYVSSKNDYSFEEKFFDKFIEIVKNCDIEKELYLPFILPSIY